MTCANVVASGEPDADRAFHRQEYKFATQKGDEIDEG
jgi:hypothetical protein